MEKLAADMMKVLSGFFFGVLAFYWSANGFGFDVVVGILCAIGCFIVGDKIFGENKN